MILKLMAALAVVFASPVQLFDSDPVIPATVDLSAIHYLVCQNKNEYYTGSAFLIAPHTLATARHVAINDKCIDVVTNTVVKAYYLDDQHDFALMSAPGIKSDVPFIKYRCDGIKPNRPYMSYGITDYQTDVPIIRENTIYSTKRVNHDDGLVDEFVHSAGMIEFNRPIAPGMSGGPVVDLDGYAVAVNNAGDGHNTVLFDLKDTILCK